MVNVNYFLLLPIFPLLFSFNTISFYLGWYLSPQLGLKWHLPRYPWTYRHREVFRWSNNITVNTATLNASYKVIPWPKNVFLKRNVYPSIVWLITVIAFNSVGFCRNNYFKIISNAPPIWYAIFENLFFIRFWSFSMFIEWYCIKRPFSS